MEESLQQKHKPLSTLGKILWWDDALDLPHSMYAQGRPCVKRLKVPLMRCCGEVVSV
jgi:hypothetical protein